MKKGLGKLQQVRGHKRARKYKNHLLGRNPRDGKENDGSYSKWLDSQIKKLVEQEKERENG